MNWKKIGWGLTLLIILGASGCKTSDTGQAQLGKLAVTTQINQDNTPVAELSLIIDTAPKIYLSAEIINGRRGDRAQVTWRNLVKDQIIATENFTGRRQNDRPYDFIGLPSPATSWLASAITLTDINWPAGDYEAVIQLNDREAQRVGFTITTEQKFDVDAKKALVKNLWLGTQINSQNQITIPSTKFDRYAERIYAVVLLQKVPAGTRLTGSWKLLETGRVINEFMTDFSGGGYLPFALALDEVGRTIWAKGNYSFSLFVDNVLVRSQSFSIS